MLINPATAIGRTAWPALAALLERLARAEAAEPPAADGAPDDDGWGVRAAALGRRLAALAPRLDQLPRALPRGTLAFRLAQLEAHAASLATRDWSAVRVPALLLASTEDNVLPAPQAARAVAARLLGARVRLLPGSGHAPLLEPGFDLCAVLCAEGVLAMPPPARFDFVAGFAPPSRAARADADAALAPLRRLVSPRFFCTMPSGARAPGLGALRALVAAGEGAAPRELQRPLLLVGNRGLLGVAAPSLLLQALLDETGLLARALVHPEALRPGGPAAERVAAGGPVAVERHASGGAMSGAAAVARSLGALASAGTGSGRLIPDSALDFAAFGAVPASARNLLRLLRRNEAALIYPPGKRAQPLTPPPLLAQTQPVSARRAVP